MLYDVFAGAVSAQIAKASMSMIIVRAKLQGSRDSAECSVTVVAGKTLQAHLQSLKLWDCRMAGVELSAAFP